MMKNMKTMKTCMGGVRIYQSPSIKTQSLRRRTVICQSPKGGQLENWNVESEDNLFD